MFVTYFHIKIFYFKLIKQKDDFTQVQNTSYNTVKSNMNLSKV